MGLYTLLTSLDLANNTKLKGHLPTQLGSLGSMDSFRLTSSGLSGNIPTEVRNRVYVARARARARE